MSSRNDPFAPADPRRNALRPLLDLSPVAMFVTELETGRVVAMNSQAEKVFDTSEAEALGRTTIELGFWRSPDNRTRFTERIRANAGGTMFEVDVDKPDGSVWYGMIGSRILEDGIQPPLIVTSLLDVTERRRAEQARTASEKRVERIIQSLSEGVMAVDAQGTILQGNTRAHEILGVPNGSLSGQDLFAHTNTFLKADGTAMAREEEPGYQTLRDGMPRFGIDIGIVKPDRSRIWINASYSILEWIDDRHPKIMLVSFFDITARKLVEDRYRGLFENMASGFALYDVVVDESGAPVDARVVEVNPAFEEITGLEASQVTGHLYRSLFPSASLEWIRMMADVASTTKPKQMIVEHDKVYDLRVFCPRPGQFATLFHDITEQYTALGEVRKSEARLREIADMSQDMLSRHDLQGVCLWASPSCRDFLGIGPEELVGRNAFEFIPNEDHPILLAGLETLVQQGKSRLQYRIRQANGSSLWVETIWSLTRDENGKPREIHCSTRDISEQRSQNELIEETQRLAHLGGWVIKYETGENRWTTELRRIYGIPEDASVPSVEEFLSRMDEGSRRLVEESNARLFADGTPWNHVLKSSCTDGSPLYLRSTCKAERDPDGNILLLRGTAQDITEQELLRQRLETASRLNQSILSTTEALVVLLDLEGRVVRFNEACQRLSGWNESELVGLSFVDRLVPPDGRDGHLAHFAELVRNPVPTRRESSWIARDGRILLISWADSVILDDSGSPSYILRTGIDVTEKRKTESVVETLVRRTSSLFGQAFFDALARDLATLLEVRGAFVAHLDGDGSRIRTIAFCMDGELVDPWESAIAGTPYERTLREGLLFHPSGVCAEYPDAACLRSISAESFLAIPLRNAGGEPIGILGVLDTSPLEGGELARSILTIFAGRAQGELERLDAEQALRRLNEELEQRVHDRTAELVARNREMESFSYSVSHDLRSPLRSISGFAQAFEEDCMENVDEQGRDYILRIRKASRRMSDLIDDLLTLSQSTRNELVLRDVDLSAMAIEILDAMRSNDPARIVECTVQPGLHAMCDPVLLRSVMENLLGNSWKYTRQVELATIAFRSEPAAEGFVQFAVVDNGAGFDMAFARNLFGTFQRLHRPEEFEGNGIGLATVKRILDRHGGTIRGFAEVDKGATFIFSLPDRPV